MPSDLVWSRTVRDGRLSASRSLIIQCMAAVGGFDRQAKKQGGRSKVRVTMRIWLNSVVQGKVVMKNLALIAGGALTIFTLAGCCNGTKACIEENSEISGSSSEKISEDELRGLERAAMSGDRHAQALVESYYLQKRDLTSYEEWLERGASRHDPAAMQRLSSYLASSGGEANCDRAIGLLNHARQLTSERQTALRDVIDMDLRVLRGQIEGAPSCGAGK